MNTSMLSSISSWNMVIIQRWKVVGALHSPKGIRLYAKVPYEQVDQSSIKELYYLLLYYRLNVWVYPSLGLDAWLKLVFHEDFVGVEGGVDPLYVCDALGDGSLVVL
ncbi:hypothetical protein Tco_0962561 [Tanacetum coccineum]